MYCDNNWNSIISSISTTSSHSTEKIEKSLLMALSLQTYHVPTRTNKPVTTTTATASSFAFQHMTIMTREGRELNVGDDMWK